jgi:hypothetical protein
VCPLYIARPHAGWGRLIFRSIIFIILSQRQGGVSRVASALALVPTGPVALVPTQLVALVPMRPVALASMQHVALVPMRPMALVPPRGCIATGLVEMVRSGDGVSRMGCLGDGVS